MSLYSYTNDAIISVIRRILIQRALVRHCLLSHRYIYKKREQHVLIKHKMKHRGTGKIRAVSVSVF